MLNLRLNKLSTCILEKFLICNTCFHYAQQAIVFPERSRKERLFNQGRLIHHRLLLHHSRLQLLHPR